LSSSGRIQPLLHGLPGAESGRSRSTAFHLQAGGQDHWQVSRSSWNGNGATYVSSLIGSIWRIAAMQESNKLRCSLCDIKHPRSSSIPTVYLCPFNVQGPTCAGEDLTALRDRAILMMAFASGGRRRSEIASLRTEQLVKQAPITDED